MNINAFKMDGLGNDFVIIDNRTELTELDRNKIIKIADRKNVGCDQVIIINSSNEYDAELRFYNSDGGESSACGNGSRCVSYLLGKEKNKKKLLLKTSAGILKSSIQENNIVETNIGKPKFLWSEIPLNKKKDNKNLGITIADNKGNKFIGGFALNVGNPHLIFFVKTCEDYNLSKIGPDLENHEFFPEKCNVTIAEIINKSLIKAKVWERGVGITKACGTAACATAVAASEMHLSNKVVDIKFELGTIAITLDENNFINMKGKVSDIKKIKIKF